MRFVTLLFLIINIVPLSISAKLRTEFFLPPFALTEKLEIDKFSMINKAKKHTRNAIEELYLADDICIYIPNLEDRDHLHALIAGTITSANIKDPMNKLLTIGLALITSLSKEMIEKHFQIKHHLAKASYHLEMANFYNALSLNAPEKNWKQMRDEDKHTLAYFIAVDYITLATMLCQCVEDRWSKETLYNELDSCMDCLLRRDKEVKFVIEALYENMHEILSENYDERLNLEIIECIDQAFGQIEKAEALWGT